MINVLSDYRSNAVTKMINLIQNKLFLYHFLIKYPLNDFITMAYFYENQACVCIQYER